MPDVTETLLRDAVADIARAAPDPHPFDDSLTLEHSTAVGPATDTARRFAAVAAAALILGAGAVMLGNLRRPADTTMTASPGPDQETVRVEPPDDWPAWVVHDPGEELLAGGDSELGAWALVGRPAGRDWPMGSAGCVLLRPDENLFTCEPRPAGRALAWVVPKGELSILEITAPSGVRTVEVRFLDADRQSLSSSPLLIVDVGRLVDRGYPPVAALQVPDGAAHAAVSLRDSTGERIPVRLDSHVDFNPPLTGGEDDRIIDLVPIPQRP